MGKAISGIIVFVIRVYQRAVSPVLGQHCRFSPSCSQYMIDAVTIRGAVTGVWMGVRRILRCHPFNPGGYDPVE